VLQARLHLVEQVVELLIGLVLLLDRDADGKPPLQAERDHRIGALLGGGNLLLVGVALVHPLGVAQIVRADVDVPVRQLFRIVDPQPHDRALERIGGTQRHLVRIKVLDVFQDDVRFDQHVAVVVERRDHRLRIEPCVFRLVVLEGEDVDVTAFPVKLLFRKAHADLLRANRTPVVIQSQHLRRPGIDVGGRRVHCRNDKEKTAKGRIRCV
jgi:hypothetical protein